MLTKPGNEQADVLEQALRTVLPATIAVCLRPTQRPAPPLYPSEVSAMARAVPRRQAEFAAGRAAARTALATLSLPAAAIPMGPDRAPKWPQGVIGSISHSEFLCAAIMARQSDFLAIGIDLEPDTALPEDLHETICTNAERRWLAALPTGQQGRAAKTIFCAKEAFFKAQYPLTKMMIDFDAVTVLPDIDGGSFTATPAQGIGPFAAKVPVAGVLTCAAGHLVCSVVIEHSG